MSLLRALVGARINETMDNYARIGGLLESSPAADAGSGIEQYREDSHFWQMIFTNRNWYVNKVIAFKKVVMSEWVPRVPGLAHRQEARQLLHLTEQMHPKIERFEGVFVFEPQGKSLQVMSGVGTLRLPPNADGDWLFSISSTGQASNGVPVLVSADVWQKIQKFNSCEGLVISGMARWRPMAVEWSRHFYSTGGIPAGYLVLNDPDAIRVEYSHMRTMVYPFTIMEYADNSNALFDYVYCGARTNRPGYRDQLARFFQMYRSKYGGATSRYLIAGDMVEELWEARFNSHEDLLAQDSSAQSQLDLLIARVNDCMMGRSVTNELLDKMKSVLSEDDLVRLSAEVNIEPRHWRKTNATLAEQCSQFLAAVGIENKQDAVLERLAVMGPKLFSGGAP